MKPTKKILAAALLLAASTFGVRAATTADVIFVVDESGSMSGEHGWLATMVSSLDTQLGLAGVTGNRYGLVGFGNGLAGSQNSGRQIAVGGGAFGTAAQFSTATGSLVTSGGTEDGWAGIDYALSSYTFRPGAAVNVVLVTDEDRDNTNGALTYAGLLQSLAGKGALLNAVVNGTFLTATNLSALGHDSAANAYRADGAGGFSVAAKGSASGFGTTMTDYYNLALATGGAAWDLNQLRLGGNTAVSFTKAFVEVKVQEIVTQPGVPDAGMTSLLLVIGIGAIVTLRRRLAA